MWEKVRNVLLFCMLFAGAVAGAACDAECLSCAIPSAPTTMDACPNIGGVQDTVPNGMMKDGSGNCVTPPTTVAPVACTLTLGGSSKHFLYHGGDNSFGVSVTGDCNWDAVRSCDWVTITSKPGSPTASGGVGYVVERNRDYGARSCVITVKDKSYTVTQDAAPPPPPVAIPTPTPNPTPTPTPTPTPNPNPTPTCSTTISNPGVPIDYQGGSNGSFSYTTTCSSVSPISSAFWLVVDSFGGGMVSFHVLGNPGGARSATITVGNATFTVSQGAHP